MIESPCESAGFSYLKSLITRGALCCRNQTGRFVRENKFADSVLGRNAVMERGAIVYEILTGWAFGTHWTDKREFLDVVCAWARLLDEKCLQPYGTAVSAAPGRRIAAVPFVSVSLGPRPFALPVPRKDEKRRGRTSFVNTPLIPNERSTAFKSSRNQSGRLFSPLTAAPNSEPPCFRSSKQSRKKKLCR